MSSRRLPSALLGSLAVLFLIAASLAPAVAASSRPSITLDTSVDGTSATVIADTNRAPHQIAACTFVFDRSTVTPCGPAIKTGKKAARYTLSLTDLGVGTHWVTVSIVLTDHGTASSTARFKTENPVADTDGDGVPDATDNCPSIANPDQRDRYGSARGDACEDTDGDGTRDVDETNICVSVDGDVILSPADSTATCFSDPGTAGHPNVAIADGDAAAARAYDGSGNTATAIGDGAVAQAFTGHDNTATAGSGSSAAAYDGDGNTATASGDGAIAAAFGGDGNSATADHDGALAVAQASAGCTVTNGTCP